MAPRGGRANWQTVATAPDPEQLQQRLHTNLFNIVGQAVEPVAHMETTWSAAELTKRVVRYIFNSAKAPELLSMPQWDEVCKKLVDHAMHGYCAACQEKKWFFEIDLAPAFTSVAWEILKFQAKGGSPRVRFKELEEFVINEYEEKLDRILLTKAMWDATSVTFADEKAQSKVYNALHKAYQGALDECLLDTRPREDLERVEQFTKRWIDDSMRRAWCSVENSDRTITEGNVVRLFQNLVAPFGNDHPFSCVPGLLIDNIGRPPHDWPYIRVTVRSMFGQWKQESLLPSSGGSKRRKTKSGAAPGGEDEVMPPVCEAGDSQDDEHGAHAIRAAHRRATTGRAKQPQRQQTRAAQAPAQATAREPEPEEQVDLDDGPEAEGHPTCTSQEDCCGTPADSLVRHLLDGSEGDVYCQACWESFLDQNPNLEGVFEETNEPFSR